MSLVLQYIPKQMRAELNARILQRQRAIDVTEARGSDVDERAEIRRPPRRGRYRRARSGQGKVSAAAAARRALLRSARRIIGDFSGEGDSIADCFARPVERYFLDKLYGANSGGGAPVPRPRARPRAPPCRSASLCAAASPSRPSAR